MTTYLHGMQKYIADVHLVQILFSPSFMHYSYAGIHPISVLSATAVSATSTLLHTMEPTSRPSMTPGEGSQQDNCNTDILAGTIAAVVTMGVLNIIFIVVIAMLVAALIRCGKRQVQDSAGIQRSSTIEMKGNIAYGHRVVETAPDCEAEYEDVDSVQGTDSNECHGIEMRKNEVYGLA